MLCHRLWTEVLGVFGPARATDCFLSIGTGMPRNTPVLRPGLFPDFKYNVARSFAAVATNTEITHILFRTLIDAFAPRPLARKYWRMNVQKVIPGEDKFVRPGWFGGKKEFVKGLDDYDDPGALDDVEAARGRLTDWTKEFIRTEEKMIQDCAASLRRSSGFK